MYCLVNYYKHIDTTRTLSALRRPQMLFLTQEPSLPKGTGQPCFCCNHILSCFIIFLLSRHLYALSLALLVGFRIFCNWNHASDMSVWRFAFNSIAGSMCASHVHMWLQCARFHHCIVRLVTAKRLKINLNVQIQGTGQINYEFTKQKVIA